MGVGGAGLDLNGWGLRCVTDWVLVGSIVFLGWFVVGCGPLEVCRLVVFWVGFGYCGVRY